MRKPSRPQASSQAQLRALEGELEALRGQVEDERKRAKSAEQRAESAQSALNDAHVELDRIRSAHAAAVQRADEAEARAARQRASPTEPRASAGEQQQPARQGGRRADRS